MNAVNRLLSLEGHHLVVGTNPYGIYVHYEDCETKRGCFLEGTWGAGETFESACEDYLRKISGKTLVFNSMSSGRREVQVL